MVGDTGTRTACLTLSRATSYDQLLLLLHGVGSFLKRL